MGPKKGPKKAPKNLASPGGVKKGPKKGPKRALSPLTGPYRPLRAPPVITTTIPEQSYASCPDHMFTKITIMTVDPHLNFHKKPGILTKSLILTTIMFFGRNRDM